MCGCVHNNEEERRECEGTQRKVLSVWRLVTVSINNCFPGIAGWDRGSHLDPVCWPVYLSSITWLISDQLRFLHLQTRASCKLAV